MLNFNINNELKTSIIKKLTKNKEVNVLLFDTETTGLLYPEMTQLAYILVKIKENEGNIEYIYDSDFSSYYYPSKKIEPMAVYITNIIRNEDVNDKVYMEELKQVFNEKNKVFDVDNLHMLDGEEEVFKKEMMESIVSDLKIDFFAGHNIYEYDFYNVLEGSYGYKTPQDKIIDTLLFDIHEEKYKTTRGRDLNSEIEKILKKKENKEEIEGLIEKRKDFHDALLDVKVNYELLTHQLNILLRKEIIEDERLAQSKENELRSYKKDDILYIRTNVSDNNIITMEDIVDYCIKTEIKQMVLVDESLINVYNVLKYLEATDLEVLIGVKLKNIDSGEDVDCLLKNTEEYRLILPLIDNYEITNEKLEDIKKETSIIFYKSDTCELPNYMKEENSLPFYIFKKFKDNKAFTLQEIEYFKNTNFEDRSLETGRLTSEEKQKELRRYFKGVEKIDFSFYSEEEDGAFPPITELCDFVKEEPKSLDGYLEKLRVLVAKGWEKKNIDEIIARENHSVEEYNKRLEEEFLVLKTLGDRDYIKYFFLVSKIGEKITFGPGRGSAAGSIIAFILDITDTNPITYDLLFERFMDPERADYPDIDLDIVDKEYSFNILSEYFNEVMNKSVDYTSKYYSIYPKVILDKYIKGKNNFVSKISTVSKSSKKTILGSFLRLGGYGYLVESTVSKEFDEDISLVENVRSSSVYDKIIEKYDISIFKELESNLLGLFMNYGIHAGGVVFSPHHINTIQPIHYDNVISFNKDDTERSKMIKMDLLGLKTRTILEEIKNDIISETREEDRNLYVNNYSSLDDPLVMLGLSNGYTTMTFQMESNGMKNILKLLSPLTFEDIIAATALFRPGPLGSGAVDDYISSAIKTKRDLYRIKPLKIEDFNKLTKHQMSILRKGLIKKMSSGYEEMLITDDVLKNLLTHIPYFESDKFKGPLIKYFEEEQGSINIYDEIIKEYNCLTPESFIETMIKIEQRIKNNKIYEEICKNTYGTMVYQEQIMKISVMMANYTKAESNLLRKVIAKSKVDQMIVHAKNMEKGLTTKTIKEIYYSGEYIDYKTIKTLNNEVMIKDLKNDEEIKVSGFLTNEGIIKVKNKVNSEINTLVEELNNNRGEIEFNNPQLSVIEARFLWYKIEKFGAYAFNKSHAASYSILTYETQYYKEYHQVRAYSFYLKYVPEKHKMGLIKEINDRGIKLDLQKIDNKMSMDYVPKDNEIKIPLNYIKGFGDKDLYPMVRIFNQYNVNSLESFIIHSGLKVKKTILESLGQLGLLEYKVDERLFSIISPKEWLYLKDTERDGELLLIDLLLKNALKDKRLKTGFKDINENMDKENVLYKILSNYQLMDQVYKIELLSKELKRQLIIDERESVSFYEELIEAKESFKKYSKSLFESGKIGEEERKILIMSIESERYSFYKDIDVSYYDKFVKNKEKRINELALYFRELLENKYKELEIKEELLKTSIDKEEVATRELSIEEKNDIYTIKLKEGNFNKIELNDFSKVKSESFLFLNNNKKSTDEGEDIFYNKLYLEKKSNESFIRKNSTNVVMMTEYMPKCDESGFCTKNKNDVSNTENYFLDIFSELEDKEISKVKLAWGSLYNKTKQEYEKFIEDSSKLEIENYNKDRDKLVLKKIIESDVEVILLSASRKSKVYNFFKNKRERGFLPIEGEKYRIKFAGKSKYIIFLPVMFPYKTLNLDNYLNQVNLISSIFKAKS